MTKRIKSYDNYSASGYYDALTLVPEQASEGVYYLLKHRLSRALGRVFELHGFGLDDHYDDTIDDFFLYLYDRGDGRPFSILESIREKEAFFGWTVGTYRHFLVNKAREELKRREMMEEARRSNGEEERTVSDDSLMHIISKAIAYADQQLPPRNLFIFYRMLLTILDSKMAIPQEMVSHAMGMNPATYRVCVNRLKTRLSYHVSCLEDGQTLPLDSAHLLMSNRLFRGFDHLYEMLLPYYESALRSLNSAAELDGLREGFSHDGMVMHEATEYHYPCVVDVRRLYEALKS